VVFVGKRRPSLIPLSDRTSLKLFLLSKRARFHPSRIIRAANRPVGRNVRRELEVLLERQGLGSFNSASASARKVFSSSTCCGVSFACFCQATPRS